MRSAADLASELDEGLKQLFDSGLALALEVQKNAMAAEPAEQARLGLTFHRLSRGVRQTAALRMKLARDAERAGREQAAEVVDLAKVRVQKRRAQVQTTIDRLIWTEAESDDSEIVLRGELDELLDIEVQDEEAFEAEDLDDQIERICRILSVPVPPPQGEVSAKPTEGASAVDVPRPLLSGSPLSPSGTAPPKGGATDDEDPILSDDYWRSSA